MARRFVDCWAAFTFPSPHYHQPACHPTALHCAQGNVGGAHADFSQVLALEPHNRQAREELRRIEALGGAPEGDGPLPGAWG